MPIAPSELWRISDFSELNGEGGLRYSGRWHTVGHRVVYLAESPAGALIEVLVHLELDQPDLPRSYNLLRVALPEGQIVESLAVAGGEEWKRKPAETQAIGDAWLASGNCALARVPSAVLPSTYNYLMNAEHPDAALFRVVEIIAADFDWRLLRKGIA
jgi:RES domain-containing protein